MYHPKVRQTSGFTLLEVMVVIVLIGVIASAIQFTFQSDTPDKALQKEALRFAGVFEVASEYSMLNNVELGLVIDKESYQFVVFNGERWASMQDVLALSKYTLPEELELEINLDDLPVAEPQLFDAETFKLEEEDDFRTSSFDDVGFEKETLTEEEREAKKTKWVPQVYLLSSGDITPFSVRIYFAEEDFMDDAPHYKVTGLYTVPLKIEGPLSDDRDS